MKTPEAIELAKKYLHCHSTECPYNCLTCEYRVLPNEFQEALWALIKKVEANEAPIRRFKK
jgi:hypothetical protein